MTETVAEIAARYGATVAPGVTVQQVVRGVSGRPLPVWDPQKNALVVPGWKEERARIQSATIRRAHAARRRRSALEAEVQATIVDLRRAGLSLSLIAERCGLGVSTVQKVLRRANVPVPETVISQQRRDRERRDAQLRELALSGRSVEEIAAALGVRPIRSYVVGLVRRALPDWTPPPAPRKDAGARQARRADLLRRIAEAAREGLSVRQVAERLGRSPHHIRGLARLLPPEDRPVQKAVAPDQRVALVQDMIAGGAQAAEIGQRLGIADPAYLRRRIRQLCGAEAAARLFPPQRPGRKAQQAREADARVQRILALHDAGATVEAILAEVGGGRHGINRTLRQHGRKPVNERNVAAARRREELRAMVARGMSSTEIAAAWGCSQRAVWAVAGAARVSLPRPGVAHATGKVAPRIAARRDLVAACIRRGLSNAEIRAMLGLSEKVLYADIRALGMQRRGPRAARREAQP
ncbi:MAG: hypothetical protein ACK4TJ_00845 [Tabrizicola sp.]